MKDKFNLTLEQNIFIAKRNIVDYIYKSANLEGIHVTFPETQAIFDGAGVTGIKVEDIIKINNLKKAWNFMLDTLDRSTDFDYLCRLNMIIDSNNSIYNIKISEINKLDIRNEMLEILNINSKTERAITLMLWGMRRQIFIDGNKRTAMMIANKEMITSGCGIISIPNEKIKSFYELLINFYETNNIQKIKEFVYNNCIDGLNF